MSVVQVPYNAPTYLINTSDVSGSKVEGASYIGAKVYVVDEKKWYIIGSDLKLVELVWNPAT